MPNMTPYRSLKTYKPFAMPIMSWQKIEEHYVRLISHGFQLEGMLLLVRHIQEKYPAGHIFGHIYFHERLVVTIYNPGEWHHDALHIKFDRNSRRWHFEYFPKPFEPSEHERYYDEPAGIEKFDQFINWLKW